MLSRSAATALLTDVSWSVVPIVRASTGVYWRCLVALELYSARKGGERDKIPPADLLGGDSVDRSRGDPAGPVGRGSEGSAGRESGGVGREPADLAEGEERVRRVCSGREQPRELGAHPFVLDQERVVSER